METTIIVMDCGVLGNQEFRVYYDQDGVTDVHLILIPGETEVYIMDELSPNAAEYLEARVQELV